MRGRWPVRIALVFVLWLGIAVAAWILGNRPQPGLLALYVAVGAAVVWLFLDVSADNEPATWPGAREEAVRTPGEDPRLDQLRRVVGHHLDGRDVDDTLHRRLADLVDHQLVARYGITREADPARAAALMGPDLVSTLAARPPYPRLTPARIEHLLQQIEDL